MLDWSSQWPEALSVMSISLPRRLTPQAGEGDGEAEEETELDTEGDAELDTEEEGEEGLQREAVATPATQARARTREAFIVVCRKKKRKEKETTVKESMNGMGVENGSVNERRETSNGQRATKSTRNKKRKQNIRE